MKKSCIIASLAMMAMTMGSFSLAEEGVKVKVDQNGVQVNTQNSVRKSDAKLAHHRASKIVGLSVENKAHEKLGKVEDLVIDDAGKVRYAAVSFGGFLGFNEKFFAVPYRAFTMITKSDGTPSHLELNVEKRTLENAPGFPKDHWPDFGEEKFMKDVDAFYISRADK